MNRLQDAARLLAGPGHDPVLRPGLHQRRRRRRSLGAGAGLADWLVYCFVVWLLLIA
jgi:hypothetical protein